MAPERPSMGSPASGYCGSCCLGLSCSVTLWRPSTEVGSQPRTMYRNQVGLAATPSRVVSCATARKRVRMVTRRVYVARYIGVPSGSAMQCTVSRTLDIAPCEGSSLGGMVVSPSSGSKLHIQGSILQHHQLRHTFLNCRLRAQPSSPFLLAVPNIYTLAHISCSLQGEERLSIVVVNGPLGTTAALPGELPQGWKIHFLRTPQPAL
jgi:hypothetical protein